MNGGCGMHGFHGQFTVNSVIGEKTMSDMLEQYKASLQDLGNIGSRHETARGFYLSVLTALLAVLALADQEKILYAVGGHLLLVVGIAGMAVCALWFLQTLTLTALYAARFRGLEAMEKKLPFQNFEAQYALLKKDWRYIPITYIECAVATVFFVLFLAVMLLK